MQAMVGRMRFFAWVMNKAGITEGQMLPWWGIAINLILFPSRIKLWIGASVYDVASDTIRVGKLRLPLHALERTFGRPSPAGHWFRVVGVTNAGIPLIECRTDGYEIPSNTACGLHVKAYSSLIIDNHHELPKNVCQKCIETTKKE